MCTDQLLRLICPYSIFSKYSILRHQLHFPPKVCVSWRLYIATTVFLNITFNFPAPSSAECRTFVDTPNRTGRTKIYCKALTDPGTTNFISVHEIVLCNFQKKSNFGLVLDSSLFCLQQGVSPYKELLAIACNQLPGTQNKTAFLVSDSLYELSQDLLEGSITSLSWYRCMRDIQLRLIYLKVVKEGASEPASTHG